MLCDKNIWRANVRCSTGCQLFWYLLVIFSLLIMGWIIQFILASVARLAFLFIRRLLQHSSLLCCLLLWGKQHNSIPVRVALWAGNALVNVLRLSKLAVCSKLLSLHIKLDLFLSFTSFSSSVKDLDPCRFGLSHPHNRKGLNFAIPSDISC